MNKRYLLESMAAALSLVHRLTFAILFAEAECDSSVGLQSPVAI